MKFVSPKTGWKTYAVVAVGIGMGVAEQFGIHVPSWVDWALTFLGFGTLRHAVTTQSAQSAADVEALVKTVLDAVSVPVPVDPNTDTTGATVKMVPVEVHVLQPVK